MTLSQKTTTLAKNSQKISQTPAGNKQISRLKLILMTFPPKITHAIILSRVSVLASKQTMPAYLNDNCACSVMKKLLITSRRHASEYNRTRYQTIATNWSSTDSSMSEKWTSPSTGCLILAHLMFWLIRKDGSISNYVLQTSPQMSVFPQIQITLTMANYSMTSGVFPSLAHFSRLRYPKIASTHFTPLPTVPTSKPLSFSNRMLTGALPVLMAIECSTTRCHQHVQLIKMSMK
jgi:hypothetical protein